MTTHKDFKRLVRGRMQKTGESFTTARATLLRQSAKRNGNSAEGNGQALAKTTVERLPATTAPVQPADFARVAGMSDKAIQENTGCTWDRWVWALDEVNAQGWPHKAIADFVHEKYKVPGWWAQAVTVGYERIRGLREKGQRRSGSWEASKSKTIGAAVGTVFKSFKQPKLRSGWLPDQKVVVRTSVPNKSLRLTWHDGTSVEVNLVAKGRSKAQVAIAHTKLPSREAAGRMKAFWSEHLDALAGKLTK